MIVVLKCSPMTISRGFSPLTNLARYTWVAPFEKMMCFFILCDKRNGGKV